MNIDFCLVDGLSSEVLVHNLLGDALVVETGFCANKKPFSLARYGFQQRRATTALVRTRDFMVSWGQLLAFPAVRGQEASRCS